MRGAGAQVLRASLVERAAPLRGRPRAMPRLRGALVLLAGGLALALGGLLGG